MLTEEERRRLREEYLDRETTTLLIVGGMVVPVTGFSGQLGSFTADQDYVIQGCTMTIITIPNSGRIVIGNVAYAPTMAALANPTTLNSVVVSDVGNGILNVRRDFVHQRFFWRKGRTLYFLANLGGGGGYSAQGSVQLDILPL